MSSPLVTVLRRRVPNPDGSMVEKPPIFGPKNVSNKSNGFVCKKKKLLNINVPYIQAAKMGRQSKRQLQLACISIFSHKEGNMRH